MYPHKVCSSLDRRDNGKQTSRESGFSEGGWIEGRGSRTVREVKMDQVLSEGDGVGREYFLLSPSFFATTTRQVFEEILSRQASIR